MKFSAICFILHYIKNNDTKKEHSKEKTLYDKSLGHGSFCYVNTCSFKFKTFYTKTLVLNCICCHHKGS